MTYGQAGAVCPRCGSAAAVHSVQELAAMARGALGGYPAGFPSAPLSPQFNAPPPPPPPPDYDGQPPPGYTGQRRPSRWSSGRSSSGSSSSWERGGSSGGSDSIEGAVAGMVMGATSGFIGRVISRRMKRAYEEGVVPAASARREAMLREQIAIAERYPDLRACLTDHVVFLAGGTRVVPMSSLTKGFTLEQADAVVAQLRQG